MNLDLLAGRSQDVRPLRTRRPTILVFDSGLGGLTVFAELSRARPDAAFVYLADDAAFPYGSLGPDELVARTVAVLERAVARHAPDCIVIACNTASTLVLTELRGRFDCPVVGTVPAVKPAAELSRTGRITVLATPGTVARDYTRGLIETYAGACRVTLVGSPRLAAMAEAELAGEPVPDRDIAAELAPCFVDEDGRTDAIVLACTHFPLLRGRFETLAPWPVAWIDPAPAIGRRVVQILGAAPRVAQGPSPESVLLFTDGAKLAGPLAATLASRGFARIKIDPLPLGRRGRPVMQPSRRSGSSASMTSSPAGSADISAARPFRHGH